MSKQSFDDYKDPRWQKKRLEVLERADWKCCICGTKSEQLHVHHLRYFKGKKLWEYNAKLLSCLCVDCHNAAHEAIDDFRLLIPWLDAEGLKNFHYLAVALATMCPPNTMKCLSILRQVADWALQAHFHEQDDEEETTIEGGK